MRDPPAAATRSAALLLPRRVASGDPPASGSRRRRRLVRHRAIEAGRDHGDLHLALHLRIDDRAEDDVGVLVRRLLDDRRRLAHLDQRQVGAAGDVDDHAARALDRRVLEQRARDRARCAASIARSSPSAMPVPMIARPIPDMIVFTSAKSRLISPGTRIRSEIPWIACRSTSSAVANASVSDVVRRDRRRAAARWGS